MSASGPGFGMHSNIVIPYILRYGTPDQIAKFVPDMCKGLKIGALAMTEPGAGRCAVTIVPACNTAYLFKS